MIRSFMHFQRIKSRDIIKIIPPKAMHSGGLSLAWLGFVFGLIPVNAAGETGGSSQAYPVQTLTD